MSDYINRRVSRRDFLKVSATIAGASLLAACSPSTSTPAAPAAGQAAAPAASTAKTTVTFWDVSSPESTDGKAKQVMINNFMDKNPDIAIDWVYKPTTGDTQISQALLTAIAGGTPPEAAYFDRFVVPAWAAQDSLTDLTDLADAAGIKQDDYFPFAWQEATGWKNRLWALPFDTDDRAIYYNTKLVTDAGLDPANPPKSIAEFDAWADKLFKFDGSRLITAGFIPWYAQGWIYSYGWTWDGKFWNPETGEITANDPKIVAACEWMASYAQKYDVQTMDSFSSAFGAEAQQPFLVDQVAMVYDGNWQLANYQRYAPDLEFGVIPMPYPQDGGREATWAGGWSVVIPKGAPNVEAGFKFISYFAGPEELNYFCQQTAHIPTLVKAAEDPFYRKDPHQAVFMDMLPIANTRPPVPIGQFLWNALAEARDLIIHGTKTPQQALDDVTTNSNEELKKFQS
jgi:multiple sugar transport system substrate-binding protein